MLEFIVEHILVHLPNPVLRLLYSDRNLRRKIVFGLAPAGITIDPETGELVIVLRVKSGFPVELTRVDFTLTWNFTDYFTRINEELSTKIRCSNKFTISFRKKLTTEELNSMRDGMLFLAGDAELQTSFARFTKMLTLQTLSQMKRPNS